MPLAKPSYLFFDVQSLPVSRFHRLKEGEFFLVSQAFPPSCQFLDLNREIYKAALLLNINIYF